MDADLELLLTTVYVTADDLLPERQNNAARRVTDAEVVTLCVAQAIMGIRLTGGSSPSRASACGICSASCPSSPDTSNAAADWPTRWSG
jgi:heterodisulfide reductase subunit C